MKPYYDAAVIADDIQCWVEPAKSLKVAVIAVLLCVWPVALFITLHVYLLQLLWNNYQEHVSLLRSVRSHNSTVLALSEVQHSHVQTL
jgi:hypothetical protein